MLPGPCLVSWPAFTTAASGATVAAGNKNVTLGPNGSFTAQLAPNAGATPAGTIYTVTYQLTDVTVIGDLEPKAYVRDYFVGDGLTTRFYLSQPPFTKRSRTIFDEEYTAATLDPTRWGITDPAAAVVINGEKLQIAGGTGADGATTVTFTEKIELGGSWIVEHGDVVFTSALSSGILGGLYLGTISTANCLAGFQITPAGSASQIQALINGTLVGAALATVTGHHYVLSTRIYSQEIYRQQQIFHCEANPAGNGVGGALVNANVRLVLEVHDVDPTNPATMVAPALVLYDGVTSGAPSFCTYALVNSRSLYCAIAFTRLVQAVDVEVRTALPGQPYATRLVGPLSSGSECNVVSGTTLDFFTQYVPALNEQIEVHYRGQYGSDSLLVDRRTGDGAGHQSGQHHVAQQRGNRQWRAQVWSGT